MYGLVSFETPCEIAEDGVLHGMFEIEDIEELQLFQPERLLIRVARG